MSIQLVKNVNFGRSKRGLATVGYTLINSAGGVAQVRTTAGVYEVGTLTGIYAALITFATGFKGSILWDTGEVVPVHATEDYSPIDEQTQFNYDISGGRWKIVGNQMIFYQEDNVTEIRRFNLFDDLGSPSMDSVFERVKV
jgi:hypothetical protein